MFGGIKGYVYAGVAVVGLYIGVLIIGFVNQSIENAETVVKQQIVLELRNAQIEALQNQKDQIEAALVLSEEERESLELLNIELRSIRDRALSTGEEENGEIAPVLGDTLRDISRH